MKTQPKKKERELDQEEFVPDNREYEEDDFEADLDDEFDEIFVGYFAEYYFFKSKIRFFLNCLGE